MFMLTHKTMFCYHFQSGVLLRSPQIYVHVDSSLALQQTVKGLQWKTGIKKKFFLSRFFEGYKAKAP